MKYYVIKLDTDGSITTVETEKAPDLKFLYEQIGCSLIESVNLWDDYIMLVDEEGWLKESPVPNPRASLLYSGSLSSIAGNVVIMKRGINDWEALTANDCQYILRNIEATVELFKKSL